MRKHLLFFSRLAVAFGAAVIVMAQAQHITPFTGAWKLNLAKSTFNPGPPFHSFTLTFTTEGTRKLDLIRADGQPFKAALPWSDGKEVPVTVTEGSMENASAVSKIRGKVVDDTWRVNGKIIEKVHGVVSADGRTLTITVGGKDKQGATYQNYLTFEKQ